MKSKHGNAHHTPATSLSTETNSSHIVPLPKAQEIYIQSCAKYAIKPDPNIIVALNCEVTHLSLSQNFDVSNLLALREALKYAKHLTSLSFRKCHLGSSVCFPLRDILKENKTLTHINLDNNGIDYHGAVPLAEALKVNNTLKTLDLRGNRLKLKGALILAEGLQKNKSLEFVDLAGNATTYEGIRAIEDACAANHIKCDTNGNALLEEVLNSITHGFGVLLSIVGGITLANDATGYSKQHQWGIGLYVTSLVVLFSSSTLCHSFTFMKKTGMVFQILDHAAIYVLIAGTYTPFCFVNLSANTWTGTILASIIWFLALIGITLSIFEPNIYVEILLYLTMGWLLLLTGSEMLTAIPFEAFVLLALGGVAYTGGIYFFILGIKKPMNHVIWHIFVLVGAILHFFAIREAVFHKRPDFHWIQNEISSKFLSSQCPCLNLPMNEPKNTENS